MTRKNCRKRAAAAGLKADHRRDVNPSSVFTHFRASPGRFLSLDQGCFVLSNCGAAAGAS